MFNMNNAKEDKEEYVSDSTINASTSSVDQRFRRSLSGNHNRKRSKTTVTVGPKGSLSHFLETKALFRKKQKRQPLKYMHSPGRNNLGPSNITELKSKGDGDNKIEKSKNQVNLLTAATDTGNTPEHLEPQVFPFKSTPSGYYKLRPNQIVYESKNLSIVAADPTSVTLNIAESDTKTDPSPDHKPHTENWTTTCLYTTVGKADLMYSDLETTSESDHGRHLSSELSLAKMGYVTDNCIDWQKFNLPSKSDLKKMLLHNILNMINPDIQVKIGGKVFKCHRIVLQCYSSFFATKTASQVDISENSVPGDVFTLIYQWMLHMGCDSYRLLRRDNILRIFKAAQYLGIKELEDQCWAFIDNVEIFSEDKAFLLYLEARKLNNKVVMELMVPRVQRFFLTLVSSKEFVEFNSDEVCNFLSSNYICVHSEEEVFMAGVRWLRYDWPQRKTYAAQIMACVRFGLMQPKLLLAMRREMSSPEFKAIINIPEVNKMLDDGLSIQLLKFSFMNDSAESIETSKQKLNLMDPVPRNFAGTDKCYQSYAEFIKDLSHYRSKQRLEVKKSRINMQMETVDKDEFLYSAVLLPDAQQKIKKLHIGKDVKMDQSSIEEQEIAARKIQKAYRRYSSNKPPIRSSLDVERDRAARKIQTAYRNYSSRRLNNAAHYDSRGDRPMQWQSRSDPSLPTVLTRSSPHANGQYESDILPRLVENETVFVFGGTNPFNNNDQTGYCIFSYQGFCNKWTKCGEMPEPRHFHSVAFLQGKIYVAGGKHPARFLSEPGAISRKVWKYDPLHKMWSRIRDMSYARRSFGFVACNNQLYVIGGRNEKDRILSKVEKFDSVSNIWVSVAPMHLARAGAAINEFKGKIWVAGGLFCDYSATNSVEYYDCQHNMWVECTSLTLTLIYGVMVPVDDEILLVGGAIGLPNSPPRGSGKQVQLWNEELQSWCLATKMTKPRHGHTAVYLRSSCPDTGYMFIMGGMSTRHECVTDNVECWSIKDDKWLTTVAPLPLPMSGAAALVLPSRTFG